MRRFCKNNFRKLEKIDWKSIGLEKWIGSIGKNGLFYHLAVIWNSLFPVLYLQLMSYLILNLYIKDCMLYHVTMFFVIVSYVCFLFVFTVYFIVVLYIYILFMSIVLFRALLKTSLD